MKPLYYIELGSNGWLRLVLNGKLRTQILPAYMKRKLIMKEFKGFKND